MFYLTKWYNFANKQIALKRCWNYQKVVFIFYGICHGEKAIHFQSTFPQTILKRLKLYQLIPALHEIRYVPSWCEQLLYVHVYSHSVLLLFANTRSN